MGAAQVYVLPGERGEVARVQTDGVNFPGVWAHADLVDVTAITTNDVAAMLRTYGVEVRRADACLAHHLPLGGGQPRGDPRLAKSFGFERVVVVCGAVVVVVLH